MNRQSKPHDRPSHPTLSDQKSTHRKTSAQEPPTQTMGSVESPPSSLSSFSSLLKQTGLAFKLVQKGGNALLRSREALGPVGFAHIMMGTWAIAGAAATVLNLGITELLERQTQTLFFHVRGTVVPPDDIVILAIDEPSLEQEQFYRSDPTTFAHLEPLAQWPWQRTAYAIAIERLMEAGAKTVAIDLIFDTPSSWELEDDEQLLSTIEAYSGRIVLAASYEDQELVEGQGTLTQLIEPINLYRTDDVEIGFINYWYDFDGRIHELSHRFPERLATLYPDQQEYFQALSESVPSFDEATLTAAQIDYTLPKGNGIFYFGPAGTFQSYPFWTVIEPDTWQQYLRDEQFKNKIVLVGPTATLFQDLHETPFGKISGVEIHANAIATLLTQQAITDALPNRYAQGLFIIIIAMGSGLIISQPKPLTDRTIRTFGFLAFWSIVSFAFFAGGELIFPTAIPLMTIALGGISYGVAGLVREKLHRLQLHQTLKHYASSPIIREIMSKQDDLRGLLQEREHEVLSQMLAGRYQLVEILGSGGFGETYIAADFQRPGQPLCVVKQLRPVTNDLKLIQLSERLFKREAESLERLGKHEQIPQLLASFKEGQEFYLVEEFIDGHPLRQELLIGQILPEPKIVGILAELLIILNFIHRSGVIHRDIKPSNIIRRRSDQKLVLIDFGAVKEIGANLLEDETHLQTVGIGTRGYMPSEQSAGTPRFSSDIYAVGIIGIQALTGLPPDRIEEEEATGELLWRDKAYPSMELEAILSKMTRYSFRDRYQSAQEVLVALEVLIHRYGLHYLINSQQQSGATSANTIPQLIDQISFDRIDHEDDIDCAEDSTLPWPDGMRSEQEPGKE